MSKSYIPSEHFFYNAGKNLGCYFENKLFTINLGYIDFAEKYDSPFAQHRLHSHPEYELQMVIKGNSEYRLENGDKIIVDENQFILFPPAAKHYIAYESPDFKKLYAVFSFEVKEAGKHSLYYEYKKANTVISSNDMNDEIKKDIEKIIKIFKETPAEASTRIFFVFLDIFIEVITLITSGISITEEPEYNSEYNDERINEAIKFIQENISAETTVKTVAQHVHVSPKQLTRIFEKVLHTTPGNYIKTYRIKKIKALLSNPSLSIKTIADIMGYNDVSSLTRAFKRMEDNTPFNSRRCMFYN